MKTRKKHGDCSSLVLDVTNASGDNFQQNWDPSHEDNFVSKTRDQPKPGSFFDHSLLWEDERPWERGCERASSANLGVFICIASLNWYALRLSKLVTPLYKLLN